MNDRSLAPMLAVQPFDEHDDDLMESVCEGPTLAKPVQALLMTLRQIKMTERSYGVDGARAYQLLVPELEALRAACKAIWEDK